MNRPPVIFTVFAYALILLIAPISQAADIELNEDCTLVDAITAANTDEAVGGCPAGDVADTISLSGDITLTAALPHITSEFTIEGEDFKISGNNRFRIFAVNGGSLTVNNLTMTNGLADWGGAIANVNGGTFTIQDSTITTSSAQEGGAIGNEATLNITDSVLTDNSAQFGGAIHSIGGTVNITGSSISHNSSERFGGAIYGEGDTLTISDSRLTDNGSEANGGAIYQKEDGSLTISSSSFLRNTAGHVGGAMYCENCTARIESSQLQHNVAENGGGAVGDWQGKILFLESIISHNTAKAGGRFSRGGAFSNDGTLVIGRSTVAHNEANKGGGIFASGGALSGKPMIRNTLFFNNRAREDGGALYADDGEVILIHVTIIDNQAVRGGGVYRLTDADVRMWNSVISGSEGGDCYGRLKEQAGNLIEDGSCFPAFTGDSMLGDLVEPSDDSPPYVPLQAGSPAIDAADDEGCPDTDQLGTPRPQGTACDIGAYELPQ